MKFIIIMSIMRRQGSRRRINKAVDRNGQKNRTSTVENQKLDGVQYGEQNGNTNIPKMKKNNIGERLKLCQRQTGGRRKSADGLNESSQHREHNQLHRNTSEVLKKPISREKNYTYIEETNNDINSSEKRGG